MKVAQKIRTRIELLPEGEVFDYGYFELSAEEFWAGAKALERLTKAGVIKRLEKGLFYKSGKSIFGELGPDYHSTLRYMLYKNGKVTGYISGFSLYNSLHLTDQFAFTMEIAGSVSQGNKAIKGLRFKYVRAYGEVTEENIQLLGYLDALKDLKKIPDTPVDLALKIINDQISSFSFSEKLRMIQLALPYPPRVRALLGAILEFQKVPIQELLPLRESVNPSTTYHLRISTDTLPTAQNWNIQ
jgi:hypothetical protein